MRVEFSGGGKTAATLSAPLPCFVVNKLAERVFRYVDLTSPTFTADTASVAPVEEKQRPPLPPNGTCA